MLYDDAIAAFVRASGVTVPGVFLAGYLAGARADSLAPRRCDVIAARVGNQLAQVLVQVGDGRDPRGAGRRLSDGVRGRVSSVASGVLLIASFRNANDFVSSATSCSRVNWRVSNAATVLLSLPSIPVSAGAGTPISAGMK